MLIYDICLCSCVRPLYLKSPRPLQYPVLVISTPSRSRSGGSAARTRASASRLPCRKMPGTQQAQGGPYVFIHVCVHVYVYMCNYMCVYAYIHMYIYIYIFGAYMYVCVPTLVCVFIYMYTCRDMCIHTYTHRYVHAYLHTYMHGVYVE